MRRQSNVYALDEQLALSVIYPHFLGPSFNLPLQNYDSINKFGAIQMRSDIFSGATIGAAASEKANAGVVQIRIARSVDNRVMSNIHIDWIIVRAQIIFPLEMKAMHMIVLLVQPRVRIVDRSATPNLSLGTIFLNFE